MFDHPTRTCARYSESSPRHLYLERVNGFKWKPKDERSRIYFSSENILDVMICYPSGMASDQITSRLQAIVEKLKATLPVAGLIDVVTEEIRSLSVKDDIHKMSTSHWAGERRANTDLYLVVDELEKVSSDSRHAIAHAESAMRYWQSANDKSAAVKSSGMT
jgi:hypothetical protein